MSDKELRDRVAKSLETEDKIKDLIEKLSKLKPFEGDEIINEFKELLYGKGFDINKLPVLEDDK